MYTQLPNGIRVFYRTSGPADGPVILLLHGFPTSSNQFRNLIPILAGAGYRVFAPDLPGFGFTEIPESLKYEHSFANFAETVEAFLDVHKISQFAVYVFDYGAPTGFRVALNRPDAVTAIFAQNGNAYDEGLEAFWDPLKALWAMKDPNEEANQRKVITNAILTYDATKWQYENGTTDPEKVLDPATWHLDWALMSRPGNIDVQLDLFKSYGTNIPLYPKFQEWLKKSQVPLIAIWGKNDYIFPPAGAHAYKKDLPNAEIHLLDGGHFLVESHTVEVGKYMIDFLEKNNIRGKRA